MSEKTESIKLDSLHTAIWAASLRINQQVSELEYIRSSDVVRIIWEEIDKRLEAKP